MKKQPLLKAITLLVCSLSFLQVHAQEASSKLVVRISDNTTVQPTEARVRITQRNGELADVPEVGIGVMYGRNDVAEGYAFQPDGAFYVDGGFEMD